MTTRLSPWLAEGMSLLERPVACRG